MSDDHEETKDRNRGNALPDNVIDLNDRRLDRIIRGGPAPGETGPPHEVKVVGTIALGDVLGSGALKLDRLYRPLTQGDAAAYRVERGLSMLAMFMNFYKDDPANLISEEIVGHSVRSQSEQRRFEAALDYDSLGLIERIIKVMSSDAGPNQKMEQMVAEIGRTPALDIPEYRQLIQNLFGRLTTFAGPDLEAAAETIRQQVKARIFEVGSEEEMEPIVQKAWGRWGQEHPIPPGEHLRVVS